MPSESRPLEVKTSVKIPVTKKTAKATRLLKIIGYDLPNIEKTVIGLLNTVSFGILLFKKSEIKSKGVTIPNTYIPPIVIAPKKLGDKNVKAKIPTNTGAQQAEVIPEKIPRVKTEKISALPLGFLGVRVGIGNFIPKRVTKETKIITEAPIIYIDSWYLKSSFDTKEMPITAGIKVTKIPAPKIRVINRTFSFSLKTLPRYAGSKKVMQQGANKATIPATNAAIKDV